MEPRNIGRALGIGVRVAGRIAGKRVAGSAQAGVSAPRAKAPVAAAQPATSSETRSIYSGRPAVPVRPQAQNAGRIAAETGRNVSKGLGGVLRPFRRVGGIVWLEATGTFFILFAVLFALRLWQNWSGIGVVSRDFTIGAAVVFLYLGISSFWRARRR